MRFLKTISLAFLLLLISCKKDKEIEEPVNLGYSYFPLNVGNYLVYDVDSTVFPENDNDTLFYKFRIMEKVDSVFNDNQGRLTYRLTRYKKNFDSIIPYDSIPWYIQDVWMMNRTATTAEKVEENYRYVKLSFPMKKNYTWNGNRYNTLGEWEYKYESTHQQATLGSIFFDSISTVLQKNEDLYIYKKIYREKYAAGVGLVYKEIYDYDYQDNGSGGILFGVIKDGLIYKMQVHSYYVH